MENREINRKTSNIEIKDLNTSEKEKVLKGIIVKKEKKEKDILLVDD